MNFSVCAYKAQNLLDTLKYFGSWYGRADATFINSASLLPPPHTSLLPPPLSSPPPLAYFLTFPPSQQLAMDRYPLLGLVRYALCTVHGTMHCSQCTVHCALCTVRYALCTVHSALCTVHCSLCTVHRSLCTVHCVICSDFRPTPPLKSKGMSTEGRKEGSGLEGGVIRTVIRPVTSSPSHVPSNYPRFAGSASSQGMARKPHCKGNKEERQNM